MASGRQVVAVGRVDLCAVVDQELHQLGPVEPRGMHEGRPAAAIGLVHIDALVGDQDRQRCP